MHIRNLFADAQPPSTGERFDTLVQQGNVVIERIVSSTDITPTEYIQEQDEWVILLTGEARLDVAGEPVSLKAGDHLFLPAHTPHTVTQVSAGATWLAVHIHPR
ncbi:cupin [Aquabacterium sp. NJ1]|uniref:cupin domain-containing protein n=1 Tax=Aquabacterium sp. NJ1 TaxID=1538295 RepID=UPI00052DD614|nr:cupin domain-containing protein [Aquabacterium sp. NJ1]KGM41709.1 cupin [Aquabacterium sp. NJ1]